MSTSPRSYLLGSSSPLSSSLRTFALSAVVFAIAAIVQPATAREPFDGLQAGAMAAIANTTDRTGGEPAERPVHYQDVFATLYHNLGIDPHRTTLVDPSGRPRYLLEGGEALRELV